MTPGALQTTTWAPCQSGDTNRAALSTAQTGGLSAAARTAGAPLIGVALTLTSPTTSADQTTSTLTSALATAYVNLRDEEDLYHKKRSGGAEAPGLRFLRITGSSARGMAAAQRGALQGCGKAAGLEMSGFPATLRTHAFGHAEKKASGEEPPRGMKAVLPQEEGMVFLVLKISVQRRVLMLLRKPPEAEICGDEAGLPLEEEGRVYFPLLMNSLALKEDGNQIHGMEIETQGQVMSTSVMPPAPSIPLTMVTPQLAENGPLLSRAWTWHPCHPESAPGMMGQRPLSTEKWKPQRFLLRIAEAKAEGAQDLPKECQNPGAPAPWMEITMTDTTEMNLLGALRAVGPLLGGPGVAVTGVEGVT